ncbi:cytidine deaminase-like protein [Colletotrichum tofieldiae]|nr:cytidine deaminase-like protein [Colletotrichum tofieldiae]
MAYHLTFSSVQVPFVGQDSKVSCDGIEPLYKTNFDPLEYVYGTTIQHNYNVGWGVMTLSSLPGYQTVMIGQILTNETDPLFSWQYNASAPCPNECFRVPSVTRGGTTCSNVTVSRRDYEAL